MRVLYDTSIRMAHGPLVPLMTAMPVLSYLNAVFNAAIVYNTFCAYAMQDN